MKVEIKEASPLDLEFLVDFQIKMASETMSSSSEEEEEEEEVLRPRSTRLASEASTAR